MENQVMEVKVSFALRSFVLWFITCGISACSVAPGMRMEYPRVSKESYNVVNEIKIKFIPITVSLVRSMEHYSKGISNKHNMGEIYHYKVGPDDILNIYVWGHPEFGPPMGGTPSEQGKSSELVTSRVPAGFLVGPDGYIYFPMIGYMRVEGKTLAQIRIEVTHLLKKYIRKPQVDVRVSGFHSKKVYVMGEVNHPGLVTITDSPISITMALNLVGGMTVESADPTKIFVIRGNYAKPDVYWLNAKSPTALLLADHFYLKSGDVLFISTANVSRWNRAISQILPSIQTLWLTGTIINAVSR